MTGRIPQIPLLTLAEYMDADIQRRHELVRDCLRDNDAAALRYSRARDAVRAALSEGPPYQPHLAAAAREFENKEPDGKWDKSDLEYSAQGLQHLADVVSHLRLGDRPPRSRRRWPKLLASGVRISVAPDVLIREDAAGKTKVGALKIRWNQRPMSAKEGEFASTILRVSLKNALKGREFSADPRLCQVVDVFSDEVFIAPHAYTRRMNRVEKACEEFRLYWMDRITDTSDRTVLPAGDRETVDQPTQQRWH